MIENSRASLNIIATYGHSLYDLYALYGKEEHKKHRKYRIVQDKLFMSDYDRYLLAQEKQAKKEKEK